MTEASNEEEDWDQLNAEGPEGPEDPTEDGTPEDSYHSDDEEVRQRILLKMAVCICLAPNARPLCPGRLRSGLLLSPFNILAAASVKQAQTSAVEPVKTLTIWLFMRLRQWCSLQQFVPLLGILWPDGVPKG